MHHLPHIIKERRERSYEDQGRRMLFLPSFLSRPIARRVNHETLHLVHRDGAADNEADDEGEERKRQPCDRFHGPLNLCASKQVSI
jgi:hypothetical protein